MNDKVELYEQVMVNSGKSRQQVWEDMAVQILQESYIKDKEIYGPETRELYAELFGEGTLFESIDEVEFQLNELEGYETQQMLDQDKAIANRFNMSSAKENAIGGKVYHNPDTIPKLSGFGSFAKKIKDLFATFGGSIKKYFADGIAGVIANPFPIIAAGAGVGLILGLIRKFKKMSDEKKKKALAQLSAEKQKKAEAILAKPEDVLKKELAAKVKPEA